MPKVDVSYAEHWKETVEMMNTSGVLLVSATAQGKPNVMTVSWATLGRIWEKPVLVVLVRPTRFTYELIEAGNDFTVNVPPPDLAQAVSFCGKVSGRDQDKFKEQGLVVTPSRRVNSPIIGNCLVHYECRVVHKNDVVPQALAPDIVTSAYPQGNFHRIYFGEILACYAEPDARTRLGGRVG